MNHFGLVPSPGAEINLVEKREDTIQNCFKGSKKTCTLDYTWVLEISPINKYDSNSEPEIGDVVFPRHRNISISAKCKFSERIANRTLFVIRKVLNATKFVAGYTSCTWPPSRNMEVYDYSLADESCHYASQVCRIVTNWNKQFFRSLLAHGYWIDWSSLEWQSFDLL